MAFVTLHDVARSAGVGFVTIDNVATARGNVSQRLDAPLLITRQVLGFERDLPVPSLTPG